MNAKVGAVFGKRTVIAVLEGPPRLYTVLCGCGKTQTTKIAELRRTIQCKFCSNTQRGKRKGNDYINDGDVTQILLRDGKTAIIDSADIQKVEGFTWFSVSSKGKSYVCAYPKVKMHRLLLEATIGVTVDHVNGDGLDNRRQNIRLATQTENTRNVRYRGGTFSGYKGVTPIRHTGKWQAAITISGKKEYLGSYACRHEAAKAYNIKAIEYFGEFANLNVISDKENVV